MPKQMLLVSLVSILTIIGFAWYLSLKGGTLFSAAHPDTITLFSAASCAQCQEVETWLSSQHFNPDLALERKEVNTPVVQAELHQVVKDCQLNTDQGIELPLLRVADKCYVGVTDIKSFVSQKLSVGGK
jgi:glutaredoxin